MRTNNTCDSNKALPAVKDFMYYGEQRFKGQTYKGCSCGLSKKVLSGASCPIGKF